MRAPCIVCGGRALRSGRRKHDGLIHDEYRRGRRRTANLLDKRWPALDGLQAVLEHYAEPDRPAPPKPIAWGCKVLKSGEVVHRPIQEETER